ncbi:hypothetical protein DB44_BX00070 [Candidatus Protochlamydia amoebophila]|uniref:Uncharacterized protein n=1 Tax=Candidatus Protochlamydia amoebophila TaxID=362787 RepID=A0A0C1HDV7_9BACT|nr:hypothetical protein DB44_BX00070 [Candidatus Protochlamydia amoebophila]
MNSLVKWVESISKILLGQELNKKAPENERIAKQFVSKINIDYQVISILLSTLLI